MWLGVFSAFIGGLLYPAIGITLGFIGAIYNPNIGDEERSEIV